MQEVYITIIEDRHNDVIVKVFDSSEKAITYAEKWIEDNRFNKEYITEADFALPLEVIYWKRYSCENDCVRVEKGEMNSEYTNYTQT